MMDILFIVGIYLTWSDAKRVVDAYADHQTIEVVPLVLGILTCFMLVQIVTRVYLPAARKAYAEAMKEYGKTNRQD